MKLITLPIFKEKLNKRNIIINISVSIALLLVIIGGYLFIKNSGKLEDLDSYVQKLSAGIITVINKRITQQQNEIVPGELEINLPRTGGRTYEQTAQQGEGITHLARRALKEYLQETGQGVELTKEHKVYIEDYIQKKTGDRWLNLGEKISFSEDLIKEAIDSSLQLTDQQLDNLKQYSSQITSF
jgi:hypothetical protein